ncbi:hypothetical protein NDU88_002429 [Pleurodeles waltl]|uniref:Uncharacterized protein n=1 Tax=Pleurodeles waltl TaxID=8319 RepID=A0AAV7VAH8_PLEWA|nr:hypothetical protein NDU88_002429 [Pleurodeles waltl]
MIMLSNVHMKKYTLASQLKRSVFASASKGADYATRLLFFSENHLVTLSSSTSDAVLCYDTAGSRYWGLQPPSDFPTLLLKPSLHSPTIQTKQNEPMFRISCTEFPQPIGHWPYVALIVHAV